MTEKPDDRDAEIAALKDRLAALEKAPAAAASPVQGKKAGGNGCLFALVAVAGAIGLMMVAGPKSDPPAASSSSSAADAPCDPAKAKVATNRLLNTRMVRGADVRSHGLVIVVRAQPWSLLSVDEQKRTVALFDCAVAGPGYMTQIMVRPSLDGADLYKAEASELLRLRQAGYGN